MSDSFWLQVNSCQSDDSDITLSPDTVLRKCVEETYECLSPWCSSPAHNTLMEVNLSD